MRGVWLILLATALWGTTGTAQELGPDSARPLAVGSLRLLVGATVLLAISSLSARGQGWRWLARPATVVAAVGMATYQPFFFSGVDQTGVAVGTLIALGSAPVFVGMIEAAMTASWPRRAWIAATIPALVGLTILGLATENTAADGAGLLLALAAGLAYAAYAISATRLARSGPVRQSAAVVFLVGCSLSHARSGCSRPIVREQY